MPNMAVVDGRWSGNFPYPQPAVSNTNLTGYSKVGHFDVETTNTFADKDSRINFYIKDGSATAALVATGLGTYFTSTDSSGTSSISLRPTATIVEGYINGGTINGTTDYYNIKTATISARGGNVTINPVDNGISADNATLSTANSSGIAVTPTINYSREAVVYATDAYGWVDKSADSVIVNSINNTAWSGNPVYITAVNVPKDKAFSVTTIADTALDTTSNLTINNAAFRKTVMTNAGTTEVSHTVSGKGNLSAKAYGESTLRNLITNGNWVSTTVSQAGTFYGKVSVNSGALNSSGTTTASGQVTIDLTVTGGDYGQTRVKPSGTVGVNYIMFDTSQSQTTDWAVTTNSTVKIAGFVTSSTSATSQVSGTPTVTPDTQYIPIVSNTFSGGTLSKTDYAKNDLTLTLASGSETNMSNITIGNKNTSTHPYFFKVNGSTPAVEGVTSVSLTAVTYSNNAGVIEAHTDESIVPASTMDAAVNVNATSANTYISLKKATFSVTNNKVYCNAAGYIEASSSTPVGTVATGTIVNNTSLPSGSSPSGTLNRGSYIKIGKGYYDSDKYYMAATNSGGTIIINAAGTIGVDGYAFAEVPASTMTLGITSISGSTVTRGEASWTSGWLDADTIIAATFANTASSGKTYVDISNTNEAPVLISGDYLYINAGYTDNLKISLAKLVPDIVSPTQVAPAQYILSGYAAFDSDGGMIAGTMATYDGSYTISYT